MHENFFHKLKVYYEDTDSGGVVYYANYLKFLERARTEALFSIGYSNKKIKDDQLDEKYNDPFYLERKETTIDALRGNLLIFTNLDANNNQKATEIRILNNYTIEEQMDKGLNSRRINAIEQYFKKRKLND